MKTSLVFLIGALLSTFAARGQHLSFSLLAEKTVAGNQFGVQFSLRTKHDWNLGTFYQASLLHTAEGQSIGNPFFGASVSAPLVQCTRINVYLNARCGLVNNHFAIVVPGLETELKICRALSLSTLMGIRMSNPSAMVKVNVQF